MSKTFKREVLQSVIVGRGTERFNLTTGQMFDFTEEELKQLPPGCVSAKTTVDLDAGDVDLKSVETEDAAPATKGKGKAAKPAGDDL